MVDISKEKRSKIMSSIKSKGTSIEERFRIALCENKIKGYRINPKMIGNPDFAFTKYKIAIFCDGDFWHGKDFSQLKRRLNDEYWINKIEKNRNRDKKYDNILKKEGWTVFRFWESEINANINKCIAKLQKILSEKRNSLSLDGNGY